MNSDRLESRSVIVAAVSSAPTLAAALYLPGSADTTAHGAAHPIVEMCMCQPRRASGHNAPQAPEKLHQTPAVFHAMMNNCPKDHQVGPGPVSDTMISLSSTP